jgi:ubiquitin carboxyl-terminal hydrolase L3
MPKTWAPLEANPDVLNKYCRGLGLPEQVAFTDILSTEDWALEMVPAPVLAVLLLFPISDAEEKHRGEENDRVASMGQAVPPALWYTKQTVGNACGTIGVLHSLVNNRDVIGVAPESYLARLAAATGAMSPDERAQHLEADAELEVAHTEVENEGQSAAVAADAPVDTHFIAFVEFAGSLFEMDGRKQFPINHGPTTRETLLKDATKVVSAFMARNPEDLRFTMIALAPA